MLKTAGRRSRDGNDGTMDRVIIPGVTTEDMMVEFTVARTQEMGTGTGTGRAAWL